MANGPPGLDGVLPYEWGVRGAFDRRKQGRRTKGLGSRLHYGLGLHAGKANDGGQKTRKRDGPSSHTTDGGKLSRPTWNLDQVRNMSAVARLVVVLLAHVVGATLGRHGPAEMEGAADPPSGDEHRPQLWNSNELSRDPASKDDAELLPDSTNGDERVRVRVP